MLKVGIIGCGKIADQHVEAIDRYEGATVVAACDQEILMARQLCDRYKVQNAYNSVVKMIDDNKPDIIHVTTPPQSHLELALEVIEAGCHLYLEKPFAVNLNDTERILDFAEKKNVSVTVGNNAQFTSAAIEMRKLLKTGYVGEIVHLESTYCYNLGDPRYAKVFLADTEHWVRKLPGKLLHNIISHGLCKIMEFMEPEEIIVQAKGFQSAFLKKLGPSDILDELRVTIIDKKGKTAFFTFSSQMRPLLHQFRIFGQKNGLIIDDDQQTVIKVSGKRKKSYLEQFIPPLIFSKNYFGQSLGNIKNFIKRDLHGNMGMFELVRRFYESINTGGDPPIRYNEIRATVMVMDEIFRQVYG